MELKGMKRLMVTEPWEIRRSTGVNVAVGEEERPLVISNADRALPFLMALILIAVLESITEMVTRTPRGSRSVGVQDPAGVVQSGVPLALV